MDKYPMDVIEYKITTVEGGNNSRNMRRNNHNDNNNEAKISKRTYSTTALYSDSLRRMIIDEVEKRPNLWDSKNKEPFSMIQRREAFAEIAEVLATDDVPLRPVDVEKQWKNMKDTFWKVKKKYERAGRDSPPRWRFFKRLEFIGQNGDDSDDSQVESTPPPRKKRNISEVSSAKRTKSDYSFQQDEPTTSKKSKINELTVNDDDDDYVYYCQYLNRQLKLINVASKTEFLKVQKKINDIIFETQIMLSTKENNQ